MTPIRPSAGATVARVGAVVMVLGFVAIAVAGAQRSIPIGVIGVALLVVSVGLISVGLVTHRRNLDSSGGVD